MEAFAVESYIQTYPGQDVDNARIFSRCHITPNTQFSTMDINATYSMVEAGLGIGINNQVNSSLWQDRVVHLPLKPAQTMNIGLAYGKNISPASEGFLHFIEDKLPEKTFLQQPAIFTPILQKNSFPSTLSNRGTQNKYVIINKKLEGLQHDH